jgi:hypothetical protein
MTGQIFQAFVPRTRRQVGTRKKGRQIFLGTKYQKGGKYIKTGKNIPNDHKIYQMAIKYFKWP